MNIAPIHSQAEDTHEKKSNREAPFYGSNMRRIKTISVSTLRKIMIRLTSSIAPSPTRVQTKAMQPQIQTEKHRARG